MDEQKYLDVLRELHEIITGQVENGYERLDQMLSEGSINEAQYLEAKKDLDRLCGR